MKKLILIAFLITTFPCFAEEAAEAEPVQQATKEQPNKKKLHKIKPFKGEGTKDGCTWGKKGEKESNDCTWK